MIKDSNLIWSAGCAHLNWERKISRGFRPTANWFRSALPQGHCQLGGGELKRANENRRFHLRCDLGGCRLHGRRRGRVRFAGASRRGSEILDALEPALGARSGPLVPCITANPCLLRSSERLTEAGVVPSVGCIGDSYGDALAGTLLGLSQKNQRQPASGPWRYLDAAAYATLEWGDGLNPRRLLESIGHALPAERERADDRPQATPVIAA
jgi:transposase InsO family protein